MVELNETLTRRVANLANLELTDAEASLFTSQIGGVLKYVDQLQKIDVTGIEPMFHPLEVASPFREDIAKPFQSDGDSSLKILKPAEQGFDGVADGGFKVPPIL